MCVNGTVSQDFCFWFFSLIIFPQASDNSIRVIKIFFDNSRRYLHVKGHQLYQRHRNKFATGVNDTSGNTAGVVDTGGIFATHTANVVDTGGKFATGVNITSGEREGGGLLLLWACYRRYAPVGQQTEREFFIDVPVCGEGGVGFLCLFHKRHTEVVLITSRFFNMRHLILPRVVTSITCVLYDVRKAKSVIHIGSRYEGLWFSYAHIKSQCNSKSFSVDNYLVKTINQIYIVYIFFLFWTALTLLAELGGYLGLFLGLSLLQISGLLSYLRIQFRQTFR